MKHKQARTFTLKKRFWGFLSILFLFIPIIIFGVWIGGDALTNELAFPDSVSFQWGIMFVPLTPLILLPVIIIISVPIFTGKECPTKYELPLIKIMLGAFVVAILATILYAVYYTNQLEQRGYVACKGIPSGFTPGSGKQYVTDLSLCKKVLDSH